MPDRACVWGDKGEPQIQEISVQGPGESEANMAAGLYRVQLQKVGPVGLWIADDQEKIRDGLGR